jgi:alkaline phosphatase D
MNNPVPLINAVYNPHLKYVDLDRHGYFILDLTATAAQADFYYTPTVYQDTTGESFGAAARTLDQQNRLTLSNTPTPPKTVQDIPAPDAPLTFSTGVNTARTDITVFSCHPNPASDMVYLQVGLRQDANLAVSFYDMSGKKLRQSLAPDHYKAGVYKLSLSLEGLSSGAYLVVLENASGILASQKILVRK